MVMRPKRLFIESERMLYWVRDVGYCVKVTKGNTIFNFGKLADRGEKTDINLSIGTVLTRPESRGLITNFDRCLTAMSTATLARLSSVLRKRTRLPNQRQSSSRKMRLSASPIIDQESSRRTINFFD